MLTIILSFIKTFLKFVTEFLSQKKKSQASWTFLLVLFFACMTMTGSAYYTQMSIDNKSQQLQFKYIADSLSFEQIKKNTAEALETTKRVEKRTDFIYDFMIKNLTPGK